MNCDKIAGNTTGVKISIEPQKKSAALDALKSVVCVILSVLLKIKQSRYKPGVAQRVPGS